MQQRLSPCLLCMAWLVVSVSALAAEPARIDIDVNQPGPAIPASFFGLMTEEINHSYDGGLFAELIQNRTFQDPQQGRRNSPGDWPIHWSIVQDTDGAAAMHTDEVEPVTPALPISLRLDLGGGRAGIANDGYWGIPVWPGTTYTASFYAKAAGGFQGEVEAAVVLNDGKATVAKAESQAIGASWQKYTVKLTTGHDAPTTTKARFVLSASGSGSVSFSLVSLFPPTYRDTPGGLRADLMKLMAELRPAFIRLPGGNYLEGNTFPTRFNWKQQIGPVEQRPGHMGCWGYRSSDGFGMPQFLLWCKQLNAEPILGVFAGYTLNGDHVDAGPQLRQYVEEALEEIEYVSGPADSTWGKRRAADGFPEPFTLRYVEVGNEDWFDRSGSYDGRFTQFFDAIRAKYPQLKIIASAPVKSRTPDLYDDHFYRSARQLAFGWNHYDAVPDRTGPLKFSGGAFDGVERGEGKPKVFVGEWATQEGRPTPTLNAALADAAWIMGLERNADVVPIQCYAPLLVNVNPGASQWPTNLIGYDALSSFGSPSYYAQVMLAQNKGDVVLPVKMTVAPTVAATESAPHGMVGVGTWQTQVEYKDIVVTAPDGKTLLKADLTKDTSGWHFTGPKWNLQDQAIKPSAADSTSWAMTGDPGWTDYTLRLKARKLGGAEGFLVLYHAVDGENFSWVNIGGWGNSRTQLEATHDDARASFGPDSSFTVETGRWYDVRVEVRGHRARCFVDDRPITDGTEQPQTVRTPLFASATYANADRAVIVKVVNMGRDAIEATLNLHGVQQVKPDATAIVLSGAPRDVNTIEQPTKVAPKPEKLSNASASFARTFPPHSLTLLRFTAEPAAPQR